jgi:hypothetical protein
VTFSVTNAGRLGPAWEHGFHEGGRQGVVDVRAHRYYSTRTFYGTTALIAHEIEADGRLTQTGGSNLCLAADISGSTPLVAARGFVFARATPSGDETTICSWEGPRLAPRANLGFTAARAVAYVPDDDRLPAQLVFAKTIPAGKDQPARYQLLLFTMSPDGDLHPQDTLETAAENNWLVFHPSGRFLYANAGSTLEVFSVEPEGRLALVESLDRAAGLMAVTTPR